MMLDISKCIVYDARAIITCVFLEQLYRAFAYSGVKPLPFSMSQDDKKTCNHHQHTHYHHCDVDLRGRQPDTIHGQPRRASGGGGLT